MKQFLRYLLGRRTCCLLLVGGVILVGMSVKSTWESAVFLYRAQAVEGQVYDVVRKKFDTPWAPLLAGNFSWNAEAGYQPIVHFVLPNGRPCMRPLPDFNVNDYATGQQLRVLTLADDPESAREDAWKFLWGIPCIQFFGGIVCAIIGWFTAWPSFRRRPSSAAPRKRTRRRRAA